MLIDMLSNKNSVLFLVFLSLCMQWCSVNAHPHDLDDKKIESVIPKDDTFEPFYPRETAGIPNGAVRAPHSHGSFFKYRHPALVETKNSAAYGFRFDGMRRFNFD